MELHWIATERVAELDGKKWEGQAKNLTHVTFIRELESLPLAIDEFDERGSRYGNGYVGRTG